MRVRRLFLVALGFPVALGWAAGLCGCSEPLPLPVAADDMAQGTADGPPTLLNLEGRLIGLDQQPLAGVAVSLCHATCRDTVTGGQGEFAFPATLPSFYTLRARKPAAPDYAELDFPLYLDGSVNPRLVPLVLPKITTDAPVPAGVQSLAVDATLALTLDSSTLMLPQGGAAGHLGGVRIPAGLYPNFCVPSARVLAMWAFTPTGITSSTPVGISLSESLGLLPGTTVSFVEISPADGRPATAASGTVSADGKSIKTPLGSGLHQLSWLLAVVIQGGA